MANEIKQAVILAGGLGTRLKPFTNSNPKPMVTVAGKPFLEHLLELLKANGVKEVVLLLGYMPDKITSYFGDGSKFGLTIKYSITDVSDETGARLKKAEGLLRDVFLLMYCDNYWPLDLYTLQIFHQAKSKPATMTLYSNRDLRTKNNVRVSSSGIIEQYDKTRLADGLNAVDIGFFIMSKNIVKEMPNENFSFEKVTLQKLIGNNELAGFASEHPYYSIGDPERLKKTETVFSTKSIILDRDGVINKKPAKGDYVKNWQEFEFIPETIEALKNLTKRNFEIYLLSNQAGVARGMMTKNDLENIHNRMIDTLKKESITIKDTIYCTHGWDDGCECRKPKPGMFFELARRHPINLNATYYIGDDERDLLAGRSAGCKTFVINSGSDLISIVNQLQ